MVGLPVFTLTTVLQFCHVILPERRQTVAVDTVSLTFIVGRMSLPFMTAYTISKYGRVDAFTDAFRREIKPWNIHVINIEAGGHKTMQTCRWQTCRWQTTRASVVEHVGLIK